MASSQARPGGRCSESGSKQAAASTRPSRTITAPSCSGEAGPKIVKSNSSERSACSIVPVSQYSFRPLCCSMTINPPRRMRARQKCGARKRADRAVFGAARRSALALHAKEAAATDLLQRAAQFGLKDDRDRYRGSHEQQTQNRTQERQMNERRDSEKPYEHQDTDEDLHRTRAANQQQDVIDEDARCNDVDDVRNADVS